MKKVVIIVILTLLTALCGTVYAVNYYAADIKFISNKENMDNGWNPENVEDALNDLYEINNKEILKSLTLKMRTYSSSSSSDSVTNYMIFDTKINVFYNYFKIDSVTCNGYQKSCVTYGEKIVDNTYPELSVGQEYSFTDYRNIWTTVKSNANGQTAYCDVIITFYN